MHAFASYHHHKPADNRVQAEQRDSTGNMAYYALLCGGLSWVVLGMITWVLF